MPSVSHSAGAAKMKGLLRERAEKAREHLRNFDQEIILGRINEFSKDELNTTPYQIFLANDLVYLVECPYPTHQELIAWIGRDLTRTFESNLAGPLQNTRAFACTSLDAKAEVYFNIFCGIAAGSIKKRPDISLSSGIAGPPHRYRSPFVWEIAYRNETWELLVKELFCWVSPTTDVAYACGIKIFETTDKQSISHMRVVVLERCLPTDPQLLACHRLPFSDINDTNLEGATEIGTIILDKSITVNDIINGEKVEITFSAARLNAWYGHQLFDEDVEFDVTPSIVSVFLMANEASAQGIYPNFP